ncbi:MAG: flagellar hook-basal body complex protein FliE [Desulfobulbaceae bacterium]|nr:flagellar hook-basal body complex protein FliE [Desulfobulbaceae bacterium]
MIPLQTSAILPLAPTELSKTKPSEVSAAGNSFGDMYDSLVDQVSSQQVNADKAIQQLHAGGEKNLHEAMISIEQADIALRYVVQVRNKALEAYQEIMRMQV